MRQLTLLVIAFSALALVALSGCAGVPDKPNVKLCTIDYPRHQLICAPTQKLTQPEQVEFHELVPFVRANATDKVPLDKADKFIAFSPDDWGAIVVYMKTLRDYATQKSGGQ
jgi:hypothetical protein